MPMRLARSILSFLLLSASLAFAQERSSCTVMKALDLDHVGPLVGKQHGGRRAGDDAGQVDNADAVQRSWHGRFPRFVCAVKFTRAV